MSEAIKKKASSHDINDKNTQWHMALPPTMKLELMEYKEILQYYEEYLLNSKALQIDLLIIKKKGSAVIKNEIGRIFRRHNIIEYKSPKDREGVNEYFKVYAYASLYKVGKNGKSYRADEITITMIREKKPVKLLKWFMQQGCTVRKEYKGVYYIDRAGFFATQLIVSKELDKKSHIWLKALTVKLNKQQVRQLVEKSKELLDKPEAEYVDALLQVVSKANREMFNRVKKEDADMYSAFVELMRPEIDEEVNKAVSQAVNKAVSQAVSETRSEITARKTVEAIENAMKKLGMSEEDACAFMDTTVEEYYAYKQQI